MSADAPPRESLADRAAALDWYHVLELPGGIVTRGHFDCRPIVGKVPLPPTLEGKRCLDVGTWDGFWAFELERRGAAEVVAVDLPDPRAWDWPVHAGGGIQAAQQQYLESVKAGDSAFALAHEALDSKVQRIDRSVYDLSPDAVGSFDFAYLGALLMHLRDPVRALTALRSVIAPGGQAVIADGVDAVPSVTRPRTPTARLEGLSQPWWWQPNRAGLHRMLESAGWEMLETTPVYFLPLGPAHPRPPVRPGATAKALLSPAGRERLLTRMLGVPHAAVRARPAAGS